LRPLQQFSLQPTAAHRHQGGCRLALKLLPSVAPWIPLQPSAIDKLEPLRRARQKGIAQGPAGRSTAARLA